MRTGLGERDARSRASASSLSSRSSTLGEPLELGGELMLVTRSPTKSPPNQAGVAGASRAVPGMLERLGGPLGWEDR